MHTRTDKTAERVAGGLLSGCSIEVTPKTLRQAGDLSVLLPRGTTVYIAHIAGTSIGDMAVAARVLRDMGMEPKPHIPARLIADRAELSAWLSRYRDEAGVTRALLLAGAAGQPKGAFESSMQLAGTGLFDRAGFRDLSFAGHPEGSRDVDPKGGSVFADDALSWKQAFAQHTDAAVSLVTQFVFAAEPMIQWEDRTSAMGIDLPIHVGIAGPASLRTLLHYGLACGIGASLRVIQRRAADLRRLLIPYAPDDLISAFEMQRSLRPDGRIAGVHLYPLGGIDACAGWLAAQQRA